MDTIISKSFEDLKEAPEVLSAFCHEVFNTTIAYLKNKYGDDREDLIGSELEGDKKHFTERQIRLLSHLLLNREDRYDSYHFTARIQNSILLLRVIGSDVNGEEILHMAETILEEGVGPMDETDLSTLERIVSVRLPVTWSNDRPEHKDEDLKAIVAKISKTLYNHISDKVGVFKALPLKFESTTIVVLDAINCTVAQKEDRTDSLAIYVFCSAIDSSGDCKLVVRVYPWHTSGSVDGDHIGESMCCFCAVDCYEDISPEVLQYYLVSLREAQTSSRPGHTAEELVKSLVATLYRTRKELNQLKAKESAAEILNRFRAIK